VSTQAPTQSLRARRRCRTPTDGAIDVAGFLQKVCDATPPPHSGIELFAPTTRRWSKCGNAIVLPGKRCAQAIDVMVDCLRPWRVPWGVCRPDIRVMMCFRNHNRAQREFGEQPTKRTPMVKKFGLHHLTVSDLAAAPSHSLHRTLAALPGPGSAHHVALSSPRRRVLPVPDVSDPVGCASRLFCQARITRSCAWHGCIMIAIACASGASVGFAVLASVTAAPLTERRRRASGRPRRLPEPLQARGLPQSL
jgi:hypothetical protein